MITIRISPGTPDAGRQAIDLFGRYRTQTGAWGAPIFVHSLSDDEYAFALEFFKDLGLRVEVVT